MKHTFTQTSLSRDFTLLAAAVLLAVLAISAWFTYSSYNLYSSGVERQLQNESQRIETTLSNEVQRAAYLLTALGKQITLNDANDLKKLDRLLKTFNKRDNIYSIFSWVNTDHYIRVSSNKGVLDTPVSVTDRDYVLKASLTPWTVQIGRPIEGRVSGRWVIPVAMGITDYMGQYAGIIMVSIDISLLTERISSLVKSDGVSFAIVSKTLIPLTQVSNDKDFVTNNFPADKLINVNFSSAPSGMIKKGSFFLGNGSYSYYKVSDTYPYIILLGYDSFYDNAATKDILFSRLLQVFIVGLFLISVLWIMRVRMIKPVMEMTDYAASVARGKAADDIDIKGPTEINALLEEVRRINHYLNETKRIEDELRNKVFMLKRAKERAEIDKRSKSEFLAYTCQEMRTGLNNIVGFAQVMRDQLYGPIENRKYRQYSADIYLTGNTMLEQMQDVIAFSKVETGYADLVESPQDITLTINKVLRFISEKLQNNNLNIRLKLQEPLPKLIADPFRLQQILMNILLHALEQTDAEDVLSIETLQITANKDKRYFVFMISNSQDSPASEHDLLQIITALQDKRYAHTTRLDMEDTSQNTGLGIELARALTELHQGYMDIETLENGKTVVLLFFPSARLQ